MYTIFANIKFDTVHSSGHLKQKKRVILLVHDQDFDIGRGEGHFGRRKKRVILTVVNRTLKEKATFSDRSFESCGLLSIKIWSNSTTLGNH